MCVRTTRRRITACISKGDTTWKSSCLPLFVLVTAKRKNRWIQENRNKEARLCVLWLYLNAQAVVCVWHDDEREIHERLSAWMAFPKLGHLSKHYILDLYQSHPPKATSKGLFLSSGLGIPVKLESLGVRSYFWQPLDWPYTMAKVHIVRHC